LLDPKLVDPGSMFGYTTLGVSKTERESKRAPALWWYEKRK